MNRRELIATLSAAPALMVAPALAHSEAPSEIAMLYQRWVAARFAYNDLAARDGDEDKDAELLRDLSQIEDQILAVCPQSVQDYAYKLLVMDDFYDFAGLGWGDAMLAKARALIAVRPGLSAVPTFARPVQPVSKTPVEGLFREWENAFQRMNTHTGTDDELDLIIDEKFRLEDRLVEEPARNEREVLMKLAAWANYGGSDLEGSNKLLATVWCEVRSLIGVAA